MVLMFLGVPSQRSLNVSPALASQSVSKIHLSCPLVLFQRLVWTGNRPRFAQTEPRMWNYLLPCLCEPHGVMIPRCQDKLFKYWHQIRQEGRGERGGLWGWGGGGGEKGPTKEASSIRPFTILKRKNRNIMKSPRVRLIIRVRGGSTDVIAAMLALCWRWKNSQLVGTDF